MSQKLKLRIVVVGDAKVGKTSFIKKYLDPEADIDVNTTTYGSEAYLKAIDYCEGLKVELDVWDTYSGDKFSGLSNFFVRNAKGWFLITDITNEEAFDEAEQWVKVLKGKFNDHQEIQFKTGTGIGLKRPIFLIGNKSDLISGSYEYEEAEKLLEQKATEFGVDGYQLTSCNDFVSINKAFEAMLKKIDVMGILKSQHETKSAANFSDTKTLSRTSFSTKAKGKSKCW